MDQFQNLNATHLYCPKCGVATPVREKLLLVLPDGELYEYICGRCGATVGKRKTRAGMGSGLPTSRGDRPSYM